MTILIDVGDGTLIAPPPAVPYVTPSDPTPTVAPTAPPPTVTSTQSAPIPQPGSTLIDIGDGTVIPAPTVTQPTPTVATADQPVITTETTNIIPLPGQTYIPGEDGRPEMVAPQVIAPTTAPPTIITGDDGNTYSIPETPDAYEGGRDNQPQFDFPEYVFDLDGIQLFSATGLRGMDFVNFVRSGCARRSLDDLAVFAESWHEGLGGGIGDSGSSYGPWQMHDGGALPKRYWGRKRYDPAIQSWAWSQDGVNYALDSMAKTSARGKTGDAAVRALTFEFERPVNTQSEYVQRYDTYLAFKHAGPGIYAQLAARAKGPTATAGAPVPVTQKPQPQPGVTAAWRDLLTVLGTELPSSGAKMRTSVKRLRKAVT